jgi:hypothetical protein
MTHYFSLGTPLNITLIRPERRVVLSSRLYCHHSAVVDADRWPDETVLLDLERSAVSTKCGIIGADIRPE